MADININFADYKTILSHRGKIIGVIDSCNINKLYEYLDVYIKDSMSKAKGILINFIIHKEQTLFVINDILSSIQDNANEEAEIIFSTKETLDNEKDVVSYQIIITGL